MAERHKFEMTAPSMLHAKELGISSWNAQPAGAFSLRVSLLLYRVCRDR